MKSNSLVCWSAQYSLLHLLPGFAPEKNSLRRKQNSKEKYHKQISFQKLPEKSNLHLLRPAGVRSWVVVLLRGLCLSLSVAWRDPPLDKVPPGALLDLLTFLWRNQPKVIIPPLLGVVDRRIALLKLFEKLPPGTHGIVRIYEKWSILRKNYSPSSLISAAKS